MTNNFKINDTVKIVKFERLIGVDYYKEISKYKLCFGKIGKIKNIINMLGYSIYDIEFEEELRCTFYEDEIQKISYLKTKYKIVKELLKNE